MERREFVALTIAGLTTALCGCSQDNASGENRQQAGGLHAGMHGDFDAGMASEYAADGVYAQHKNDGIILVRRGEQLMAISSICTHRKCDVRPQKDGSFLCPCHGSTFDRDGHVTRGPAKADLPQYSTRIDDRGHVIVALQ